MPVCFKRKRSIEEFFQMFRIKSEFHSKDLKKSFKKDSVRF